MAYTRTEYTDKHGRNGENVYTHIESYTVNMPKQTTRVKLVTYISEEAKDAKREPIDIEGWKTEGDDYDVMFGEKSEVGPGTRNSDVLKVIYEKLNTTPKWGASNVKSTFEKIIKDKGELKVGDEISRELAVKKKLEEDVDFEVIKE
tara:strand:- start:584 stop:1024 length:441 start_codon:yes stop_codon:yes gene_type:complete